MEGRFRSPVFSTADCCLPTREGGVLILLSERLIPIQTLGLRSQSASFHHTNLMWSGQSIRVASVLFNKLHVHVVER